MYFTQPKYDVNDVMGVCGVVDAHGWMKYVNHVMWHLNICNTSYFVVNAKYCFAASNNVRYTNCQNISLSDTWICGKSLSAQHESSIIALMRISDNVNNVKGNAILYNFDRIS